MKKPTNVAAAAAASAVALTDDDRSGIKAPLLANSYEFSELDTAVQKAIDKAEDAKGDAPPALGDVIVEQAQLKDVLEGHDRPAVPEGMELAQIRTQGGQIVHAPVGIVVDGVKTGEEAAAMTRDESAAAVADTLAKRPGADKPGTDANAAAASAAAAAGASTGTGDDGGAAKGGADAGGAKD